MSHNFSDERLNAFIDNEVDLTEKQQLFDAFREDEGLRKRACELQKTHDLVKLTYQSVELPEHYQTPLRSPSSRSRSWFMRSMAASILVVVGSLLGWFTHQQINPGDGLLKLAQVAQPPRALTPDATRKIMLHVSTNDEYRLNLMLEETEHLLQTSRENNEKILVEILTNGPGLALVKKSAPPSGRRLQALQSRYDNLSVTACAQAIERLRVEKGVKLELIPSATVVNSALGEVLERQREGWTYIRI